MVAHSGNRGSAGQPGGADTGAAGRSCQSGTGSRGFQRWHLMLSSYPALAQGDVGEGEGGGHRPWRLLPRMIGWVSRAGNYFLACLLP
jgi:hypothetical protein